MQTYPQHVVVDEVIAFHDTHASLCAELHIGTGLAAHDGTHVGLEDADNAVGQWWLPVRCISSCWCIIFFLFSFVLSCFSKAAEGVILTPN